MCSFIWGRPVLESHRIYTWFCFVAHAFYVFVIAERSYLQTDLWGGRWKFVSFCFDLILLKISSVAGRASHSFPSSATPTFSLKFGGFVHMMCLFLLVQVVGNEGAQLSPIKVHEPSFLYFDRSNQLWRVNLSMLTSIFATWDGILGISTRNNTFEICFCFFFASHVQSMEYNHWTGKARLKSRVCFKDCISSTWVDASFLYFGENILSDWLIEWSNTYLHMYHEEEDRRKRTITWTVISWSALLLEVDGADRAEIVRAETTWDGDWDKTKMCLAPCGWQIRLVES